MPIDNKGHMSSDAWKLTRERCRVKRVAGSEEAEVGHVIHKPGGTWAFHYDIHGDPSHDEAGYRFDEHKLGLGDWGPGELVAKAAKHYCGGGWL